MFHRVPTATSIECIKTKLIYVSLISGLEPRRRLIHCQRFVSSCKRLRQGCSVERTQHQKADYWKSQAKKYCDFCKCWLADNKPSVEFHEKGKKHKENVARRLRTIGKQSRRDQKESIKIDTALKRMESAAMEAYRKDIENNADISSKAIKETLEKNNLALSSKKIWHERKSKEGYSYYWNTETNETLWEAPSCGFMSIIEQQAESFATGKKQLKVADSFKKNQELLKVEEEKLRREEERAAAEREKMKARRVVEEEIPSLPGPILEQRTGPYGQWKTVSIAPQKTVDLQLPKQGEYIAISIPTETVQPIKEFKEKTITSLEDSEDNESCVSFKKRKFGSNQKRHVRQRLDDN